MIAGRCSGHPLFSALTTVARRERALSAIKSHSARELADPCIGCRKRLVRSVLHVIENDQRDCGKGDSSKASSNKRLHGTLPLSDIAFDYIANSQIGMNGVRDGLCASSFMESPIIRC